MKLLYFSFKQYIPRKHRCFIIKNYKLGDATGYTYDTERQKTCHNRHDSNSCCSKTMTRRVKGHDHKLFMDNYFSSPGLCSDVTKQKINCWTIWTRKEESERSNAY
jgi:hypothetical protein